MKVKNHRIALHLMLLPGLLAILVFNYGPMFGVAIAFENYIPAKGILGSAWVGLGNFRYMFNMPDFLQVLWNTLFISFMKMAADVTVPLIVALLLNEIRKEFVKRSVQTLIYLPHFLSWVILGGVMVDILSTKGIVNQFLQIFGINSIFFLGSNSWFPYSLVISHEWKEFGYNTIIYLAALTTINPSLYEAAVMDGAKRWRQVFHITLPGILPIVVLMVTLSIGNVLNAGFEQVLNLYSPLVYASGDIIDTFVYRMGLIDAQYGVATAAGLFKSVISFILISLAYISAYRFANYRIF